VEPTHYTGEPGYITDTENSPVIAAAQDLLVDRIKGDAGVLGVDIVGGDDSIVRHDTPPLPIVEAGAGTGVASKTEL